MIVLELKVSRGMTFSFSRGDTLEAARDSQEFEGLDQIRYAVLERNGGISIIPKQDS